MEIEALYNIYRSCTGVATDSRTIKGGELFFALKGENFDGNQYALKALESGAAYAVADEGYDWSKEAVAVEAAGDRLILVENSLRTMQKLAAWHRNALRVNGEPLTVIGLTGTNGKTTTKELIKAVLSTRYKVSATEGNFNNSIGVPLTVFGFDENTELAVVEMGASHPGDIKELVEVACPDYGLITNVGKAHLLGFGSFEGVKKTKGELYDYLLENGGTAFINVDNSDLMSMLPEDLDSIPYGLSLSDLQLMIQTADHPFLRFDCDGLGDCVTDGSCTDGLIDVVTDRVLETHLVGAYNADNVMAALAVGNEFGVPMEEALTAIAEYIPSNSRSQLTKTEKNTLIVDAYNANPTSMAAALDNFAGLQAHYKVLMLGDMLELGKDSVKEHAAIINKALHVGAREIYLVGEEFRQAFELLQTSSDSHASDPVTTSDVLDSQELAALRKVQIFATSTQLQDYISNGSSTGSSTDGSLTDGSSTDGSSTDSPSSDKGKSIEGATILVKGSRGIRMENVLKEL